MKIHKITTKKTKTRNLKLNWKDKRKRLLDQTGFDRKWTRKCRVRKRSDQKRPVLKMSGWDRPNRSKANYYPFDKEKLIARMK